MVGIGSTSIIRVSSSLSMIFVCQWEAWRWAGSVGSRREIAGKFTQLTRLATRHELCQYLRKDYTCTVPL
jgi:hypothetical protein